MDSVMIIIIIKHNKFPYWPTRDVSLLSGHASYHS